MSKKVSFLSTEKLQVYIELLQNMAYDIQNVGVKASLAEPHGAITKSAKDKLHKDLYAKITKIDAKLLECLDELNRRLKTDLGLPHGFQEVNKFLEGFKTSHPDIYFTEAEFKMKKAEDEKRGSLKKVVDDAGIDIPQMPEPVKVKSKKK